METKQIIFTDNKSSEQLMILDTSEKISGFLETFRLETGEVIEINDGMFSVKNISEKAVDSQKEISVEVEFIDLIENQPTA
ncbi:hypothetical protein [Chryseobacterium sp. Leaf394]|uniref:hypothetical protein n=1 Tax=Chryseobacterium sp. Leaf394 TaxID=1736361 RepID=UPI0006FC9353|nr:hypothetical protein [Chryseobacterium sp. Leaf394]KQS89977.1 hypothetical protein ASG21_13465 [Chryseobacterium sp. Leaf394]